MQCYKLSDFKNQHLTFRCLNQKCLKILQWNIPHYPLTCKKCGSTYRHTSMFLTYGQPAVEESFYFIINRFYTLKMTKYPNSLDKPDKIITILGYGDSQVIVPQEIDQEKAESLTAFL